MLSQPQEDFTGGELYVLEGGRASASGQQGEEEEYCKREVHFQTRGDVVVFKSNGQYFHGMNTVTRGRAKTCCRIVVGLLHPHN